MTTVKITYTLRSNSPTDLKGRSDDGGVCEPLETEVGEAADGHAEGQEPGPVAHAEGEPAADRVGDGQVLEVAGQGLADEVGHALHLEEGKDTFLVGGVEKCDLIK